MYFDMEIRDGVLVRRVGIQSIREGMFLVISNQETSWNVSFLCHQNVHIFLALFLVRAAILDIESNGKRNISKMVLVKNYCCQGRLTFDQIWGW